MPPVNDSAASAIVLSGQFTTRIGSNVDATDDVGGTASVWYRWNSTPSELATYLVLSTRSKADATSPGTFDTVLKVFENSGGTVGNLIASTEAGLGVLFSALPWAGTYGDYTYWSREAELMFTAPSSVFIAVSGKNGAQGTFNLSWYHPYRRYLTSRCVRRRQRWLAVGQAAIPNVSGPSTTRFQLADGIQEYPAGRYRAQYCSGAWRHDSALSTVDWVTTKIRSGANANLFESVYFIRVNYNNGGTAHAYIDPGAGVQGQATEQAIVAATRCDFTDFTHQGGPIELQFLDEAYFDNVAGSTLPAFTLYRQEADFKVEIVATSVGSFGQTFTVELRNISDSTLSGVNVERYDVPGDPTQTSQAMGDIPPGGTFSVSVTFPLFGGLVLNVDVAFFCLRVTAAGGFEQFVNGSVRVGPVV